MAKIISFDSSGENPEREGLAPYLFLKNLWNGYSSKDSFTKFFILTALLVAVVAPNFVARYFIKAAPPPASVDLEVENTTLSGPVILGTDSLSSNGKYIVFDTYSSTPSAEPCLTTPPSGAGVASSEIDVAKDGYYFVWSRIRGESDSANSYYLQIDDSCLINVGDQNGMASNVWAWVNYQGGTTSSIITSNLTVGKHSVKLIGREGKTSLDRIIFTLDANCSPVDAGANCLPQPSTQSQSLSVSGKTASILVSPSSGTFDQNQTFNVDLKVDGGGQEFNAAQAKVVVSSNIRIVGLTIAPVGSGGCNFVWANRANTPIITDPSFGGAILKSSSLGCTVYTLTLQPLSLDTGTITLVRGSVKSYATHQEILNYLVSGSYAFSGVPTPTPTSPVSTLTPTPTQTPQPTPTPTQPPLPTLTLTPVPTSTPIPTTPTPTPVTLQAPTIDSQPLDTYSTSIALSGARMIELTAVYINNSLTGITYPTSTTWSSQQNLTIGPNTFVAYGKDISGNQSPSSSITIVNHSLGDISGDGIIDLTDLSMFATDFENTGTLNYALSDMSSDGIVDLTDFSIVAKIYNGT